MANLRFALFGTGFWSTFQLAGWLEVGGVDCVAMYNRTVSKAHRINEQFGGKATVYESPEALLKNEDLDFVDICTAVETHAPLTRMAAERGLDVVCQKPMATTLEEAEEMVAFCRAKDVKLLINENFRWQTPIRQVKTIMDEGRIGTPFRARINFTSSFPVFDNQPFLKDLEHFLLTDVGVISWM